mmetsp:Transcript_32289/g.53373  ORF Transcript_32289/g.53373 Transcript_32289/m.53373 type:complete len:250 (-) Transcript_32289:407-1156(-)
MSALVVIILFNAGTSDSPAWVISLPKHSRRRANFWSQGLNATWLEAVDGALINLSQVVLTARARFDLTYQLFDHRTLQSLGAIACYLSHFRVWRRIAMLSTPALVFEDDVIVVRKDWAIAWQRWLELREQDPEPGPWVYWLGWGRLRGARRWGAHAYGLSPEAARDLLAHAMPMDIAVDFFIRLHSESTMGWKSDELNPPAFEQRETRNGQFASTIQRDKLSGAPNPYTVGHVIYPPGEYGRHRWRNTG